MLVLRWEREGTRCALRLSLEVGEVQLGGQNSPVLPIGLGCTVPVEFAGVVGRLSMGRMMRWVGLGNEVPQFCGGQNLVGGGGSCTV